MRRKNKIIISILLTLFMTFMPVQSIISNIVVAEAATVKLNKKELELYVGGKFTLKISGTSSKPKWSTSKKSVATVSKAGKVTAKKAGTTTITASIGSKKYKCIVNVNNLSISTDTINLQVADTSKLSINGATKTIKWSSSDSDIVFVNKDGFIYAQNEGSAKIVGTHSGKRYTCDVTVKNNSLNAFFKSVVCSRDTEIMVTAKGLPEDGQIHGTVANSNIIDIEWGEWLGDSIPINIEVLKIGTTTITITADGIDEEFIMEVDVIESKRPPTEKLDAEAVYEKCSSATVEIETDMGIGSGFLISSGTIVTNYHIIEGQSSIKVMLQNGKVYDVSYIIGYNKDLDIALLSIPVETVSIPYSLYSPKVGETVYAIGSPFGLTDTFTNGIISSVSRHNDDVKYIQTNASITFGNSGGPLINAYGEVIGINTFGVNGGEKNLNFAIDINHLFTVDTSVPITVKEYYDKYVEENYIEYTTVYEDNILSSNIRTCQLIESYNYVEGMIMPGTNDYYKIIVPEETRVVILGFSKSYREAQSLIVGILDSNEKVLYTSEDIYGDDSLFQAISVVLPAGTYYIVATTYDDYTRQLDYLLSVTY